MGYFLYVCRQLGHSVQGLDLGESEKYNDVIRLLEIPRITHRVERMQPLPKFDQEFDDVTAFQMTFNGHGTSDLWGTEEWDFFLSDLCRIMNPSGRVTLQFQESINDSRHLTVIKFLRSRGAELHGDYLQIKPGRGS